MTDTSTDGALKVADTSFLYALFSDTDTFHSDALEAARSNLSIVLPAEILSETLALIQYRQDFEAALRAGKWIRQQDAFRIPPAEESFADVVWKVFESSRGRLSFPDSVVVAWCRALKAKPLAYDDEIKKAA